MKTVIYLPILFCTLFGLTSAFPTLNLDDVEIIVNGSTYVFTNVHDGGSLTVLPNGTVVCEEYFENAVQKWTMFDHPSKPHYMRFQNDIVPLNFLSGLNETGDFPQPLALTSERIMNPSVWRFSDVDEPQPVIWQVLLQYRWCLQTNGLGKAVTFGDCDWEPSPWQYWVLQEVS